jgi:hypothetical protein
MPSSKKNLVGISFRPQANLETSDGSSRASSNNLLETRAPRVKEKDTPEVELERVAFLVHLVFTAIVIFPLFLTRRFEWQRTRELRYSRSSIFWLKIKTNFQTKIVKRYLSLFALEYLIFFRVLRASFGQNVFTKEPLLSAREFIVLIDPLIGRSQRLINIIRSQTKWQFGISKSFISLLHEIGEGP